MNLPISKNNRRDTAAFGTPITGSGRTLAIEDAISADESAIFGAAGAHTDCDLMLSSLAVPVVVITNGGTPGSTAYGYRVADVGNFGLAPSLAAATATGNATLSVTNFNILSWTAVIGHTYNIYRASTSGTPSTTGLIGTVTADRVNMTFNDSGLTAAGNVPTANTTGSIFVPGILFTSGRLMRSAAPVDINDASGHTLVASDCITSLLITRRGAAGVSDALPSAAALVAALPGIQVGMGFELYIRNANSSTLTLTGSAAGITLASGNTNTVATLHVKKLLFVFTNVTPAAEAVTVYTLEDTAY